MDHKGWWRLHDGQRCEPLTVRDAFSRYILAAQVLDNTRTETVQAEFLRLFQLHGLPKVIKSDNGSPFASAVAPMRLSTLSASWVALGIELEHRRPGHPRDNGAHERMHKNQAALDLRREEYNHQRPHEALQERCPAEVYRRSTRALPLAPVRLDYGPGYFLRKVNANGSIKWAGQLVQITTTLAGWEVGLRLTSEERPEVWSNYLHLGAIGFTELPLWLRAKPLRQSGSSCCLVPL